MKYFTQTFALYNMYVHICIMLYSYNGIWNVNIVDNYYIHSFFLSFSEGIVIICKFIQ